MDILHLVDRLEELFNEGRGVWFTRQVFVDEDRMLDLIDQMRVSIPDEIRIAQQLLSQRDRMIAQTQEEANRTIALVREKSEKLVERDGIVLAANERADQIIKNAKIEADAVLREADEYVLRSLGRLEMELERLLNQVHNGISTVERDLVPPPKLESVSEPHADILAPEAEANAPDPTDL